MRFSVPVACIRTGETTFQSAGRMLACLEIFYQIKNTKPYIYSAQQSHAFIVHTPTACMRVIPSNTVCTFTSRTCMMVALSYLHVWINMSLMEMLEWFSHKFIKNYMTHHREREGQTRTAQPL